MFQPVIPSDGLAGWRFLNRTYDSQLATFSASNEIKRDTDYFIENIGNVTTAEELVSDRRLLTVALGAFGLQDDINNRFFIQKILEEGTQAPDALANRFADSRYREFSEAFGLGPNEFRGNILSNFGPETVAQFEANSFEQAAGNQSNAMRVALYAERTLPDLATGSQSVDAKWFTVMGDPPLRQFFEKALNLPSTIGQIDIDQQLGVFKERAQSVFGTDDFSQLTTDEGLDDAITKYIVREQLDTSNGGLSGGAIALTLLQS
ncbi:MAG: DUF1217 domain-containing protein [Pseudomonadota bacterium]